MNDIDEKYSEGLDSIVRARKVHMRNGFYVLVASIVGGIATPVFPPAIILCAVAFCIYWYSHWKTARISCPRCGEAFGTKFIIPLGLGTNKCESCGLSLETLVEPENRKRTSKEEWFE